MNMSRVTKKNMEKALLALGLVGSLQIGTVSAQKSVQSEHPRSLLKQGTEMFQDKNYLGALHRLTEFRKQCKDASLSEEVDYMIVSSHFYRGDNKALVQLMDFLEEYPATYRRAEVSFLVASCHYDNGEWGKAVMWFEQTDASRLTVEQREDYDFRYAYALMKQKRSDDAYRLWSKLAAGSKKYGTDALYYKAYIDFQAGRFAESIPAFERLQSNAKYREPSLFFLTQTAFNQENTKDAVKRGEDFLKYYPHSNYLPEVYRILGNSYFRQGNFSESIARYEQYIRLNANPFREDMLLLGCAYINLKRPEQAVEALKQATSYADVVGQEAFMQLGLARQQLNDVSGALLAFQAASKMEYNATIAERATYNYAVLLTRSSQTAFDQSVNVLQRFLQTYPGSAYAPQINEMLAATLLATKNFPAALAAIDAMPRPDAKILEAKQMILLQQGIQHYIDGDTDKAIRRFDQTVEMGNYSSSARRQAFFWRGESYYKLGNYATAMQNYQNFIFQAQPADENLPLAYYNLGYAFFKQHSYNQANVAFGKYLDNETNKISATYGDALNRIGDTHLFARNYTEASNYYTRAANQNTAGADYATFQQAFVQGLQRNYTQKISTLDGFMNKFPHSAYMDEALYEKSRALAMLQRETDAIPVLETLMERYSNTPSAQKAGVQLGQMYHNINNLPKAIAAYQRVAKEYPDTDEARAAIQSLESIYKEANDVNSYAQFVNSLGKGMQLSSSRQDTLTFQAAENVFMKGQKQLANDAFSRYLQNYPNGSYIADVHYYMGVIAEGKKDTKTALVHLEKAATLPNGRFTEQALSVVAEASYTAGHYDAAYRYYQRWQRTAADASSKQKAHLGIARTAWQLSKYQEVVEWASFMLVDAKTTPDIKMELLYLRGMAYLKLKEVDKGVADLRTAATDPRYIYGAEAQYQLANLFLSWKSYDKAIAQVNAFMEKGTPHAYWMARAIVVLADAYAGKGDHFSARQYLESLKDSYTGKEADIAEMIAARLSNMNQSK